MNFIKRIVKAIFRILGLSKSKEYHDNLEYWEDRARKFGSKAVFNISHQDENLVNVTKKQKDILYPLLKKQITKEDKVILDFGCGTGRFTNDLAKIINGQAIGIDPTYTLLKLCHPEENVRFVHLEGEILPFGDDCFDIVFICLVMGGIKDDMIDLWSSEINRVLKSSGMLFLIENTSDKKSGTHWYFRNKEWYISKFNFANLLEIGQYFDQGEPITIMSGRK